MRRIAGIYKIKPEMVNEYKKDHDNIWPEMVEGIEKIGIKNYSIFFREDGTLFSYMEVDDIDKFKRAYKKFVKSEVRRKWDKKMAKYFVSSCKENISPEMINLIEIFHID